MTTLPKRISFTDGNGKRHRIRLAGYDQKSIAVITNKIDEILSAKASGRPISPAVTEWLASRDDKLFKKLSNTGLVKPRRDESMVAYFDDYAANNAKSTSWISNHSITRKKIVDYFGDRLIRDITPEDAEAFRVQLAASYAQATVAGDIKRLRRVFRFAVKDEMIYSNPFAEVVAGDQSNDSRKKFVSREVIAKVVEACPNAQWRLLVALARFGGLRNVSETFALKWQHVDWTEGTIRVPGAKGKDSQIRWRTIPIYDELLEPLREAFDPENEMVINIEGTAANVYNTFLRIVKRADQTPWSRLWHNLRASRDTELSEVLPGHAVAQLMGNSVAVSEKHYKMIMPHHFESLKANSLANPKSKTQSGTKMARQPPETDDSDGNESQPTREFPDENEKAPAIAEALVHPGGFEPPTPGSEDRCSIQLSYGCMFGWLPQGGDLSRRGPKGVCLCPVTRLGK